jgi:transposase
MKKVSTVGTKQSRKISQQKLTVGLDLGDRSSWYCVLDEAGRVLLEQRVSTTAKALREVFGGMPRSRVALETGMHSPWVSRLLSEVGHEVIVAHARNVRLIGESRKKDDRLDAQTLARLARIDPQLLCPVKHRSAKAQADLTVIRARAGLVRARTALVNTARGLAKSYGERLRGCNVRNMNPEKAEELSPELQAALQPLLAAAGVAERTHRRVPRADREAGARELSAGGLAEAGEGSGHADRVDVFADAGRCASLPQEPRRGLLSGTATQTKELWAARTADAYQQGRRSLSADAAGARGTFWDRSAPIAICGAGA